MKSLTIEQMENLQGEGAVRCALGIVSGAVAGFAGSTGNGVAFVLGPIGVTWGAIGAVADAVLGGASTC